MDMKRSRSKRKPTLVSTKPREEKGCEIGVGVMNEETERSRKRKSEGILGISKP